jgi:methylglutaconyl-CoA hydratase
MYSEIIVTTKKRCGIITLNRPERRNSLDDSMIREMISGLNYLSRENTIRTIVITGVGESFCAGMDIGYIHDSMEKAHEENVEDAKSLQKLLLSIRNSKKTIIAMVNGPAMGGGCGIAAACDIVFASLDATLGIPEMRIGFVPAVILPFIIGRMGEGKAREFVLKGEIADASRAKSYGLITDAVPAEQLSAFVFNFAEQLAISTSPASVTLTKELFMRLNEMNYRDGMEFAVNLNAMVRKTEDFKKGIDAFLNKEKIKW